MSAGLLAIDAGHTGISATVVTDQGRVLSQGYQDVPAHRDVADWTEHAPDEIWRATLTALRIALTGLDQAGVDRGCLRAVGITNRPDTTVLWDRETLGSPRRALTGPDRRAGTTLAWLAEHEPRTWQLVEQGRYAVGTLDSFLISRMTRGTWHVTDVANASTSLLFDDGGWSEPLCAEFGVPPDALPEVVPSWGIIGATEPRSFGGLGLPIAGIASAPAAGLFGQACFDLGDLRCAHGGSAAPVVLANTGGTLMPAPAGLSSRTVWRSPAGQDTHALESALNGLARLPQGGQVIRVDGDGALDDQQCQALANRLGLAVERPAIGAVGALGAAYLAGLGAGIWSSIDDLRGLWELDRRFEVTS